MTANPLAHWKTARCLAVPLGLFAVCYALCLYDDHWLHRLFGTALNPSVYCSGEMPPNIFGAACEAWNDSELALQAAFLLVILPFLSLALIHVLHVIALLPGRAILLVQRPTFRWASLLSFRVAVLNYVLTGAATTMLACYLSWLIPIQVFVRFGPFPWVSVLQFIPKFFLGCAILLIAAALLKICRGYPAPKTVLGYAVSPTDMPNLWNPVRSWAAQASLKMPAHLVVTMEPTTFYSQGPVISEDGRLEGGTLACSLPLARIFDESKYCASVVSHLAGGQATPLWWQKYVGQVPLEIFRTLKEFPPSWFGPAPALLVIAMWIKLWAASRKIVNDELFSAAFLTAARIAGSERAVQTIVESRVFEVSWPGFVHKLYSHLREVRMHEDGQEVLAREYYSNVAVRFAETCAIRLRSTQPAIMLFDDSERWERRLSQRVRNRLVWE